MHTPALKFTGLLVALSSLLAIASPARAQVSMVVSPPTYNLTVKPGEVLQKSIKVTNPSEVEPLRLKATVSDFIVSGDAGVPLKVASSASGRYLASPWFSLDEPEFTLDPLGQMTVTAVITVPSDVTPGGHYAGVFFEPVVRLDKSQSSAYASTEVGALFELTVEGDLHYDALIKDFHPTNSFYEFGPVDFSATIENQSDTHITPRSSITIKDMLGRTVETLKLDEPNIFPFASRKLSGHWDQVWGLGRYEATLSVMYAGGLETNRTLYFWVAPYRLIAGLAVILLALIALIVVVRRHAKSRHDSRDTEIDELKRRIVELENQR